MTRNTTKTGDWLRYRIVRVNRLVSTEIVLAESPKKALPQSHKGLFRSGEKVLGTDFAIPCSKRFLTPFVIP